ncbi:MAG: Hsp33 family molecular chaperone HslO [Gammaproteobacteria bacterium]|nr:Hsp33 family molecular chaperone HslO [Gammaproteobacteria bacterium]MDH3505853.1 Hsp33 family molecular chaperone HslO [Gammaproteobacteria bacterium]
MNEVQTFVFEDLAIRGALVRLEETWRQVLAQHHYPQELRRLLGEGIAATVLLATGLKGHPRVSLQLQGDGRVKLLLVQCSADFEVRGMAQLREAQANDALLGAGRLAVNLDTGENGQQFQGIVPLVGPDLRACLEAYFAQSEQLPTRLYLFSDDGRASGLLLQALPGAGEHADDFETVTALAATIRAVEIAEQPAADLLEQVFADYTLRLFRPKPVTHDCRCTPEYLARIVRMLGTAEIDDLLRERGHVELVCEFCNRAFRYDDAQIEAIFAGQAPSQPLH